MLAHMLERTSQCTATAERKAGRALYANRVPCREGTSMDAATGLPQGGPYAPTSRGRREYNGALS